MGEFKDIAQTEQKWRKICAVIFVICLLGLIGCLVYLGIDLKNQEDAENAATDPAKGTTKATPKTATSATTSPKPATTTPKPGSMYNSFIGEYDTAAVAGETYDCSKVGVDILRNKSGSVVDSAIATLLCVCATNFQSCGIGGGFFMTLYHSDTKTASVLMARETAPDAATQDMYVDDTEKSSVDGGKAIAVPTEVIGYWEAHQKYGKLPWTDLFQPTIDLCENGFEVGRHLGYAIEKSSKDGRLRTHLKDMLTKDDGTLYGEGDTLTRKQLAATLRIIAYGGAEAFYNGSLVNNIIQDIKDHDGIITAEDLKKASATWVPPVNMSFTNGKFTTYNPPPPSSGIVVNFILKILDGYNMSPADIETKEKEVLSYHRIVEAMKFGFGKRSALGDEAKVDIADIRANITDPSFAEMYRQKIMDDKTMPLDYYEPAFTVVNDGGTTQLSIIDAEGNALSATSTVNTYFGSCVMGNRTGIIFNNEMDDFSTPGVINSFGVPASATNFIEPGKRPMSSMTPTIIVDEAGDVKLVLGASGGTRIINSIIQNIVRDFWFDQGLKDATDLPRIHHQLLKNVVYSEPDNPTQAYKDLLEGLAEKGHTIEERTSEIGTVQAVKAVPCASDSTKNCVQAICDGRKGGRPDGY